MNKQAVSNFSDSNPYFLNFVKRSPKIRMNDNVVDFVGLAVQRLLLPVLRVVLPEVHLGDDEGEGGIIRTVGQKITVILLSFARWTQWAAVAMYQWLRRTPPHWYDEIRMCTCGKDEIRRRSRSRWCKSG